MDKEGLYLGQRSTKPLCTRAELWAAIEGLEAAVAEDLMTGDGDALAQARAHLRALLGMDAPA